MTSTMRPAKYIAAIPIVSVLVISLASVGLAQEAAAAPIPTTTDVATWEANGYYVTQVGDINAIGIDADGNPLTIPISAIGSGVTPPGFTATNDSGSWEGHSQPADKMIQDSERPTAYSVIGTDQRIQVTTTTSYPNNAIVWITKNGSAWCTGWLVSPDTVVTAGHCVYDAKSNIWYSGLALYPGRNGNASPYGSAAPSYTVSNTNWTSSGNINYDWGVIKLNKSFGNWFGLKWQSSSYNGTSSTVRGYPGDKTAGTMWTMTGAIQISNSNTLCYSMDTYGGQSGSPVYISGNYAIAIHTNGVGNSVCSSKNAGTRITENLYNVILAEAW